ncbi:MAG: iron ABC transporter permease, partial [Alphaproteobacteria bacterium]
MSGADNLADMGAPLATGYRRFVTRRMVWLCALAAALCLATVVNVMTGPAGFSLGQVIDGLLHPDALEPGAYVIL